MTKKSELDSLKDLENILQEDLFTSLVGQNPRVLYGHLQNGASIGSQVSDRINYLHEVVHCLKGGYTDEGIRRWFRRERKFRHAGYVERKSPLEYLSRQWDPDDENAKEVLKLAQALLGGD